jgi:hypothetical protein
MKPIPKPVPRNKLIEELTPERLLRYTLKGDNEIYSFNFQEAPNLMFETGRLREISYRAAGCGSGNSIDIDNFDVEPPAYRQLIVWNQKEQEIIGGYRYAVGSEYENNISQLSMTHYFNFSKRFISDFLPFSIELGRAWVNLEYQATSGNRKSIFALDNLWEGIGAVISENIQVKYLYGKITIPENYDSFARVLILWLLNNYFKDKSNLINPCKPIASPNVLAIAGIPLTGFDFDKDYQIISRYIRSRGITIPPLVSAYLGIANKMSCFGTAVNPELGQSFETGIMIAVRNIYPEKYERYVKTAETSTIYQTLN